MEILNKLLKNRVTDNRGFTLLEFLIYIALVSSILVSMALLSIQIAESRSKAVVINEVTAAARNILDIMTQRIRESEGINVGTSVFGTDPGVLSIQTNSGSTNPTIFSLSADDGTLLITEGVQPAAPLTSSVIEVTNLTFTNMTSSGQETIRIEFDLHYTNPSGEQQYEYSAHYQTSVNVRK